MYLCGVDNSEITYLDSKGTDLSSKTPDATHEASDSAPRTEGRRRGAAASLGVQVDFTRARMLPNTGATCDVYEYRYGSKRFLVKRIKEEHDGKSVILEAFRKEYEIGVTLDHRALPTYRFITDDYIVMDYVDGRTLAAMIRDRDPWLEETANVRRMLTQLTEVIDYMHQKNVVHCDVKCDNVMITSGTRNVVLIDLGEAYTYALDRFAGDPRVYGLDLHEDMGSPDIDFHGIGMIVDRLEEAGYACGRFRRFRQLCDRRGVTPARLLAFLRPRRYGLIATVATVTAALIAALILMLTHRGGAESDNTGTAAPARQDTVVIMREATEAEQPSATPSAPTARVTTPEPKAAAPDYKSAIENELTGFFAPVESEITGLERLLETGTASDNELLDRMSKANNVWLDLWHEAYDTCKKRHPDVDAMDVEMAVYNTRAFQKTNHHMSVVAQALNAEMRRRHPDIYND